MRELWMEKINEDIEKSHLKKNGGLDWSLAPILLVTFE